MQRYNPTDEEIQNVHDYLMTECPGTVNFHQWARERRAQLFTITHNGMRHQVVIALEFFGIVSDALFFEGFRLTIERLRRK